MLPGRILQELADNDRIVGGVDAASSQAAARFYESFVSGAVLLTDSRTAEMVKLVENSFRDVNIAFANEVSVLSATVSASIPSELIRLANRHPRVSILQPGPGVGGHCIAVDPWFIVSEDPEHARLIQTAREVNDAKPEWVVAKLLARADAIGIKGRPVRVACLGLAYKPDIDDLRESPALAVARLLHARGVEVLACEPNLGAPPRVRAPRPPQDASAAPTSWPSSSRTGSSSVSTLPGTPVLDFCGVLQPPRRRPARSIGRGAPVA